MISTICEQFSAHFNDLKALFFSPWVTSLAGVLVGGYIATRKPHIVLVSDGQVVKESPVTSFSHPSHPPSGQISGVYMMKGEPFSLSLFARPALHSDRVGNSPESGGLPPSNRYKLL